MLSNNGVQLTVNGPATTFSFGAVLGAGSAYSVSIASVPAGYTCSIANGAGSAGAADVGNVAVTCSLLSFTLGGTISGLTTSGLVLANGATTLTVAANATTFALPGTVTFGSGYNVTVQTQPTGRTCLVVNGAGTVLIGNVVNVSVSCTPNNYTLGGTISGLGVSGLVLANGASTLAVASSATTFTMPATVAHGGSYSVIVQAQPIGRTCTVTGGTGTNITANVPNIVVNCVSSGVFTVGGTVSGLTTAGVVLVNGATTLSTGNGAFTMPGTVAGGTIYNVTVQTQPTGRTCSVANGIGTVGSANVTNIAVTCAANGSYILGGTLSGLTAGGLVLANGADALSVPANSSSFTMPTSVTYQAPYSITVYSQPSGLNCSVGNGAGIMPAGNVTNVSINCGSGSLALQPRDLDGNRSTSEAYYDPGLNITWLQNTNLGAGSAYDDGKFSTDGRMTWTNAMAWAASLQFPAAGAGSGWRLPTMVDTGQPGCSAQGEFSLTGGTSCGQNVFTTPASPTNYSEMAHIFQVTLGNRPAYNTSGGINPGPWLGNIGPFSAIYQFYNAVNYATPDCNGAWGDSRDCRDDAYWTNLPDASRDGFAWKFLFGEGEQIGDAKNVEFFAWAVHDGDVGNP